MVNVVPVYKQPLFLREPERKSLYLTIRSQHVIAHLMVCIISLLWTDFDLRKSARFVWKQIAIYQSAELRHEQVTNIAKGDNNHFYVTGAKGTSIMAKHVILAFGYSDVHPNIPGFTGCWADTIIPCPFCDGYENRDRVWGVVASSERDAQHFPKMI